MKRRRNAEKGMAAVEFGLALTVILAPLLIGTIDLAQVIHVKHVLANAAEEGAMLAARSPDAAVTDVVNNAVGGAGLDVNRLTVSSAFAGQQPGAEVKITLSYSMADSLIVPWDELLSQIDPLVSEAYAPVLYNKTD